MIGNPQYLRYSLTRRQRLIPLLRIWGPGWAVFQLLLMAFFAWRCVGETIALEWRGTLVFGGLFLFMAFLFRQEVIGLIDVIVCPSREMDITVEENALGILIGSERWYLFMDGITRISNYVSDVWTIENWNGMVVHIDASAISTEQVEYICAMMERGRTAEGIATVIERGRRIQALKDSGIE